MSIFEKLRKFSQRSTFVRNFLGIASANLFAQVILVLALPVLTHLYTPAEFGLAALFMAALQLSSAISTWNFDRMVPNARTRISAQILCIYAISCVFLASLICILLLAFDAELLYLWRGRSELGQLIYYLPLAIVAMGCIQIVNSWFARETFISPVSKSVVSYTVSYLLFAITGGILGFGTSALIFANIGSLYVQMLTMAHYLQTTQVAKHITKNRTLAIGKKNLPHASTLTLVRFVNTLSLTAPVFLLAQIYSVKELGAYALMLRLVVTPLGILTKSLSLSFWSRAAELTRENRLIELHSLYKKVSAVMILPALLALIGCTVGSKVVPLVLGNDWEETGSVLLMIVPYVIGVAIVSPTNHLWVLEKQRYQLIADCTRLLLMLISIFLAHFLHFSFTSAVLALSVSSLIGHIILFLTHIILHRKMLNQNTQN